MKKFFELTHPYKFEVTDLTVVIYVIATIVSLLGYNPTIPFFIGSAIATAFCWKAHRINLMVLNIALFTLNAYNLVQLF